MDAIQTHPSNAAQAKAFTAPGSLSFPGAAGELTPPSSVHDKGSAVNQMQGAQVANGTGVTPATPVATPGAAPNASGLTPTLQYDHLLGIFGGLWADTDQEHRRHGQSRLPLGLEDDCAPCQKC